MTSDPRPWNPFAWALLGLIFLREFISSTLDVIRIVLAPSLRVRPGVVSVPLNLRSQTGITLLANMVSLTPGTTSLHVSVEQHMLYVHAMDARDPDAVRRAISDRLERPTLRVLR